MEKKFTVLLFIFLLFVSIGQAQGYYPEKKDKPIGSAKGSLLIGGGIGAQFGNITLVGLNPRVGYFMTDRWVIGAGLEYSYYSDTYFEPTYDTHILGACAYTQYYFLPYLFAQTEYGFVSYDQLLSVMPREKRRIGVSQFLVGGGIIQSLGGHTGAYITVLFDLIEDENSPYSNPILQLGFQVKL